MKLRFLRVLPLMMVPAWLILAVIIFSGSIGGDRYLYREVIEEVREHGLKTRVTAPPPMARVAPPPPPPQVEVPAAPPPPAPVLPLDPSPAVWELRGLEVVKNEPGSFEARFEYYGGALEPRLEYQARQPVWVIDLPADRWVNHLENDYRWPEGLARRLALGLHQGYLRLVLYLRRPDGGPELTPLITLVDQKTFSLTLKGAPTEGGDGEGGHDL